jgi:alpha-amylase
MAIFFPAPDWAKSTNIYEVNVRQYTPEGSFKAFADHLPRLANMGVETLWFMPITPISKKGMKGSLGSYYAAASYRSTNPEFGTVDDFSDLVREAHRLGMKVIIDWVANHTGLDHEWTVSHPQYYVLDEQGGFTERNGWDDVIDLNYQNPELRSAMIKSMLWWIQHTGIDGFRCDMAHLVPLDFWREARQTIEAACGTSLFWLAECEEAHYHEVFDATYTWAWMHLTRSFALQEKTVQHLWEHLYQYDHGFAPVSLRAFFTSNHDENSWNGTEYEKYGGLAAPLAVFSATWNGIPLLYSGQEIPNHKRLKFFDKDELDWPEAPQLPQLHDFYQKLLQLRKNNLALQAGDTHVVTYRIYTSCPLQVFGFMRQAGDHRVLVLLNFSDAAVSGTLESSLADGNFLELFSGRRADLYVNHHFSLPPHGYEVWVHGTQE